MAGKARVHDLAKELGVTSKEILARLSAQGEFVKSASSTVEAPVARRLRESFGSKLGSGSTSTPRPDLPGAPRPAARTPRVGANPFSSAWPGNRPISRPQAPRPGAPRQGSLPDESPSGPSPGTLPMMPEVDAADGESPAPADEDRADLGADAPRGRSVQTRTDPEESRARLVFSARPLTSGDDGDDRTLTELEKLIPPEGIHRLLQALLPIIRSLAADPNHNDLSSLVRFGLMVDANVHLLLIEKLAVTYGDPDIIAVLRQVASMDSRERSGRADDVELANRILARAEGRYAEHPSEIDQISDELTVDMFHDESDGGRESLMLKATQEDPWRRFARDHDIAEIIPGVVTKVVHDGAIVRVDEGIEELLRFSDPPGSEVDILGEVGAEVMVTILDIDLEHRRIYLSFEDDHGNYDEAYARNEDYDDEEDEDETYEDDGSSTARASPPRPPSRLRGSAIERLRESHSTGD